MMMMMMVMHAGTVRTYSIPVWVICATLTNLSEAEQLNRVRSPRFSSILHSSLLFGPGLLHVSSILLLQSLRLQELLMSSAEEKTRGRGEFPQW
ncbi:hypothetical protein QBC36DRAFT_322111 [Triangularia setosa]|uniref:Uncharacterized protein n=1 Tax=Triangularia setosa TaxID=2587417 RepID=A0AAN6WFL2_9PEZI|nr:hypothetical protein QBC36DRAFT_322111 [Podospora setosa]